MVGEFPVPMKLPIYSAPLFSKKKEISLSFSHTFVYVYIRSEWNFRSSIDRLRNIMKKKIQMDEKISRQIARARYILTQKKPDQEQQIKRKSSARNLELS